MALKDQLINYFEFNKSMGSSLLYFSELPSEKKYELEVNIETPSETKEVQSIFAETTKASNTFSTNQPLIHEKIMPRKAASSMATFNNLPLKDFSHVTSLEQLYEEISNCQCCGLSETRNKFVFGSGNPNADIMVIGEAPGADEDMQGLPFVGRAGQLLTDILKSINFSREEVYIANVCKCRPPANRKPTGEEIYFCENYLKKQIDIIKPKFILALGLTAAEMLFKQTYTMGKVRGQILDYHGIKTLITYHPAALLRNPAWKRLVWEDVKYLRKLYDDSNS